MVASATDSASCPSDEFFGIAQPIVGVLTYHTIATIVSAACTVLACIISLGIAFMHLRCYTRSHEQRQIVRIVLTPAIISATCFFGVWFYDISGYIKPIGEYYECFALVAVYYLFLTYVTSIEERGNHPYGNLELLQARYGGTTRQVYYKTWYLVLQIIPVRLILLVANLAVSGSECKLLSHQTKAHTAINVISTISMVLCFVAILRLTKFLKPSLGGFKPLSKLLTLKIMVGLSILQDLIFSILSNTGTIKATNSTNLPDLLIGTPGLMTCCECFIFSVLFIWPYSAKSYSLRSSDVEGQGNYRLGMFSAIIDVLNITDVISGVFYCLPAFRMSRTGDLTQLDNQGYGK